ncbi:MAG: hypothetical protein IT200_13360 [Thermoleophilia bacterium]|nr:hypothetical protein [Thermoleophilia bacterium]
MRRAELRLESFLAESRGRWVTMRDIKANCDLDWHEAGHVWDHALPRLVGAGLLEARTRMGRTSREYLPTHHLVVAVAGLQWSIPGTAPVPA